MFDSLSRTFDGIRSRLAGRSKLTEKNIQESLREVRVALLDADVNFEVLKDFIAGIREKVLGESVIRGANPGDQFVKSIHDGLVELMGPEDPDVNWVVGTEPTVILMAGLQGSGKTTTCGKLAQHFLKMGKKPLLVAADVQRPAAIRQLQVLGEQVGVPVHAEPGETPPAICEKAVKSAAQLGCNVVILDTAGRLHVDDDLMTEVSEISRRTSPHEILLVCDANTGQDAVNSAKEFNDRVELTGIVMTKMDSGSRGGAVLSVKTVTGKPVKFVGTGEKLDALDQFHPDRMADRILGMGDVVGLVEKAQDVIDEEEAETAAKQLLKGSFNFNDFLRMLEMVKGMGPIKDLMKMMPGMGAQMSAVDNLDEKEFFRNEAIIRSMTPQERVHPEILNMSRRGRIARGSGVEEDSVHQLVRGFKQMKNQMKDMKKSGLLGGMMDPTKVLKKQKVKELKVMESEGRSVLDLPEFRAMRPSNKTGKKQKRRKRR